MQRCLPGRRKENSKKPKILRVTFANIYGIFCKIITRKDKYKTILCIK
jgi:hypothetical protein